MDGIILRSMVLNTTARRDSTERRLDSLTFVTFATAFSKFEGYLAEG